MNLGRGIFPVFQEVQKHFNKVQLIFSQWNLILFDRTGVLPDNEEEQPTKEKDICLEGTFSVQLPPSWGRSGPVNKS